MLKMHSGHISEYKSPHQIAREMLCFPENVSGRHDFLGAQFKFGISKNGWPGTLLVSASAAAPMT